MFSFLFAFELFVGLSLFFFSSLGTGKGEKGIRGCCQCKLQVIFSLFLSFSFLFFF